MQYSIRYSVLVNIIAHSKFVTMRLFIITILWAINGCSVDVTVVQRENKNYLCM